MKCITINHSHKRPTKAIKMTLGAWTVLSSLSSLVCAYKTGRCGKERQKEIERERGRCGPPVQGRGAWDVQMKWEALSRRLLLSMKAEAAPRLMRGEVEPPVGPPQAHSLRDEKAIPVAEQVPALARTCLI